MVESKLDRFSIILYKASGKDASLLFKWVNEKEVRQNSIQGGYISWVNHLSWFKAKLDSDNTFLFIGYLDKEPIGQIRFELVNGEYLIDYSVDEAFRGRGFGTQILSNGINLLKEHAVSDPFTVKALVKYQNVVSLKIFEALDFKNVGKISKNGVVFREFKSQIFR
jgi:RimJ/RimL family protein N-acetyltransferase